MNTESDVPQVLIVDDEPDTVSPLLIDASGFQHQVIPPGDVTEADLYRSDVVLVDYQLDVWPERDEVFQVSLKPADGVALAAVLRSQIQIEGQERPVAFALHAADLDQLGGGLGTASREHVIAHAHNLEWAFRKQDREGGVPRLSQIRSLAEAVRDLPESWPGNRPAEIRALVERILSLSDGVRWQRRAWESIEDCHPPVHELSTATHGLAFLRWMLHKILPYPTFLRNEIGLALKLRVSVESLVSVLDADQSKLREKLSPVQYNGILKRFLGRHWWRAGIDAFLWDLTEGNPFDREMLARALDDVAPNLEPLSLDDPALCVDHLFRPLPTFVEREEAVEIQPDDWPTYADPPWVPLEVAQEEEVIRTLVVKEDRDLIGEPESETETT